MIDAFITDMEDTFGKYRNGMSNVIKMVLKGMTQTSLDLLFKAATENYDLARPPSLKVLRDLIKDHRIPIDRNNYSWISVCEFCDHEFSTKSTQCPNCGKLRKYGKQERK